LFYLIMSARNLETLGTARQDVRDFAASDHLLELAQEALPPGATHRSLLVNAGYRLFGLMPPGPKPDIDLLKKIEYAMLIEPISKGVEGFLEDPTAPFPKKADRLSSYKITNGVATVVAANVKSELRDNPDLKLLKRIARARASGQSLNRARSVWPLSRTVERAAISSAITMHKVVEANALTIWRAGGAEMSHEDLVAQVRASHSLALAQPVMHLDSHNQSLSVIESYTDALIDNRAPLQEILTYDPARELAHTQGRPKQWAGYNNHSIGDRSFPDSDMEIGCPFSFSPTLVRRYYGSMVDLVERYNAWPSIMDRPPALLQSGTDKMADKRRDGHGDAAAQQDAGSRPDSLAPAQERADRAGDGQRRH
jgi:hypothetical protein